MCRFWQLSALSASWWAAAWVSGWAIGWQTGLARNARWLSQQPTLKLRTPILTLHVGTLKPNPDAGKRKPYAMRGERLRLVKPD